MSIELVKRHSRLQEMILLKNLPNPLLAIHPLPPHRLVYPPHVVLIHLAGGAEGDFVAVGEDGAFVYSDGVDLESGMGAHD